MEKKLTNVKRIKASELYQYIEPLKENLYKCKLKELFSMNFWVLEPTDYMSAWRIEQNWCDTGMIEFNLGGCGEAYRWWIEEMNPSLCIDIINILIKEEGEDLVEWIDEEHTEIYVWVETTED